MESSIRGSRLGGSALCAGGALLLGALALLWAPRSSVSEGRPASPAAGAPAEAPSGARERQLTCVLLVRHAEKESEAQDADLSEAGRERADRLAKILSKVPVTALISSDRLRTRRTLEPISRARKLRIEPIPEPKAVAERIRKLPVGSMVVAAHHSDTIPQILEALGLETPKGLFESDGFSNLLWIIVPPGGSPELLHLLY